MVAYNPCCSRRPTQELGTMDHFRGATRRGCIPRGTDPLQEVNDQQTTRWQGHNGHERDLSADMHY